MIHIYQDIDDLRARDVITFLGERKNPSFLKTYTLEFLADGEIALMSPLFAELLEEVK